MYSIRLATKDDLRSYWDHIGRHKNESGNDGDLIFSIGGGSHKKPFEEFSQERISKWELPLGECGWERVWLLFDQNAVRGSLKLVHQPPIPETLHRAVLMMGLERAARRQGNGSQLIKTAIDWAKSQTQLEWLMLWVFAHNIPAQNLYKKFGFIAGSTVEDMFRIQGQKISDIEMNLKLR